MIQTVLLMLLALAVGGVAGALLYARFAPGDNGEEAQALRRELESYRKKVSDHFVRTAELVNNLTDSYKAVFDHLRQGADELLDEETKRQHLELGQSEETVTLRYIGYHTAPGSGQGAASTGGAASRPGSTASPGASQPASGGRPGGAASPRSGSSQQPSQGSAGSQSTGASGFEGTEAARSKPRESGR